jgi:hypothetical protein
MGSEPRQNTVAHPLLMSAQQMKHRTAQKWPVFTAFGHWYVLLLMRRDQYCRAGCESSRPFGFQGTPPRDSAALSLSRTGFAGFRAPLSDATEVSPRRSAITGEHDQRPGSARRRAKSLEVSLRRERGLSGGRAREERANPTFAPSMTARRPSDIAHAVHCRAHFGPRLHREPETAALLELRSIPGAAS